MNRSYSRNADHADAAAVTAAAIEEAHRARIEQARRDAAAERERNEQHRVELAARRERERLAKVTPLAELRGADQADAVKRFEAESAARKWPNVARLVILPALQRRGDGELTVAFQHFVDGHLVTSSMPLADAGVLLDADKSPTLRIAVDRAAWDAAQAARAEEARRFQANVARLKALQARREAEIARMRALPAAHRAAVYVAHDLRETQPKLAAAFADLAKHLEGDDTATLRQFVEQSISDEEMQ